MDTIINLSIFTILIALTAFFVATEFAIVKIRSSRIDQLVLEGKKGAKAAQHVTSHLDEYLSACQLGITVTALGIGMVGESTFEFILHPLFESIGLPTNLISVFTIATAFFIATFSHVVIGELAPKTIAIQKAEKVTLLLSGPIMIFYKILFPLIWLLNGSARLLLSLFGIKSASEHESTHTEEELRSLMKESYESGEINQNELNYVNKAFEFDNVIAREVMVPRTEMVAIQKDISLEELFTLIQEEKYTRYPVYDSDRDNIIGVLNIKDLITSDFKESITKETFCLEDWVKPMITIIDTVSIQELLKKMKKEHIHIAILIDEYGGTSGLVTIEDIIEELVGDIKDEFDEDELNEIEVLGDDYWRVEASTAINKVEELLSITFGDERNETIRGWFLNGMINPKDFGLKEGTNLENSVIYFKSYEFKPIYNDKEHITFIDIKRNKGIEE